MDFNKIGGRQTDKNDEPGHAPDPRLDPRRKRRNLSRSDSNDSSGGAGGGQPLTLQDYLSLRRPSNAHDGGGSGSGEHNSSLQVQSSSRVHGHLGVGSECTNVDLSSDAFIATSNALQSASFNQIVSKVVGEVSKTLLEQLQPRVQTQQQQQTGYANQLTLERCGNAYNSDSSGISSSSSNSSQLSPQMPADGGMVMGVVTQIEGTFGMVNGEIFFQFGTVIGEMPSVGDKVVVEAEPMKGMPFKFNAKRVQMVSMDFLSKEHQQPSSGVVEGIYQTSMGPSAMDTSAMEQIILKEAAPFKSPFKKKAPPPPIISVVKDYGHGTLVPLEEEEVIDPMGPTLDEHYSNFLAVIGPYDSGSYTHPEENRESEFVPNINNETELKISDSINIKRRSRSRSPISRAQRRSRSNSPKRPRPIPTKSLSPSRSRSGSRQGTSERSSFDRNSRSHSHSYSLSPVKKYSKRPFRSRSKTPLQKHRKRLSRSRSKSPPVYKSSDSKRCDRKRRSRTKSKSPSCTKSKRDDRSVSHDQIRKSPDRSRSRNQNKKLKVKKRSKSKKHSSKGRNWKRESRSSSSSSPRSSSSSSSSSSNSSSSIDSEVDKKKKKRTSSFPKKKKRFTKKSNLKNKKQNESQKNAVPVPSVPIPMVSPPPPAIPTMVPRPLATSVGATSSKDTPQKIITIKDEPLSPPMLPKVITTSSAINPNPIGENYKNSSRWSAVPAPPVRPLRLAVPAPKATSKNDKELQAQKMLNLFQKKKVQLKTKQPAVLTSSIEKVTSTASTLLTSIKVEASDKKEEEDKEKEIAEKQAKMMERIQEIQKSLVVQMPKVPAAVNPLEQPQKKSNPVVNVSSIPLPPPVVSSPVTATSSHPLFGNPPVRPTAFVSPSAMWGAPQTLIWNQPLPNTTPTFAKLAAKAGPPVSTPANPTVITAAPASYGNPTTKPDPTTPKSSIKPPVTTTALPSSANLPVGVVTSPSRANTQVSIPVFPSQVKAPVTSGTPPISVNLPVATASSPSIANPPMTTVPSSTSAMGSNMTVGTPSSLTPQGGASKVEKAVGSGATRVVRSDVYVVKDKGPPVSRGNGGMPGRGGYQSRGGFQSRGGYQPRGRGGYQSQRGNHQTEWNDPSWAEDIGWMMTKDRGPCNLMEMDVAPGRGMPFRQGAPRQPPMLRAPRMMGPNGPRLNPPFPHPRDMYQGPPRFIERPRCPPPFAINPAREPIVRIRRDRPDDMQVAAPSFNSWTEWRGG